LDENVYERIRRRYQTRHSNRQRWSKKTDGKSGISQKDQTYRPKIYHYVRQQLELGELQIEWKAGKWNKADILTKALTTPKSRRRWLSGTILASRVLDSTGFWVRISARTPILRNITMGGDITGGFCPGAGFPSCHKSIYRVSEDNFQASLVCPNIYWYLSKKIDLS
jgi:hypothetical protein